jgi:hypothetical protein
VKLDLPLSGNVQVERPSFKFAQRDFQMTAIDLLQSLCTEAAEMFGNDWSAVNLHITRKLETLVDPERAELRAEVERILRYQPPDASADQKLQ